MSEMKGMLDGDKTPSLYPNDVINMDSECSKSLINYLQVLNALCAASARVATDFRSLVAKTGIEINNAEVPQQVEWDSISRSLLLATSAVHSKLIPIINSFEYCFQMMNQIDHKNKNVIDDVLSVINVQYQFCVSSCKRLVVLADKNRNKQSIDKKEFDNRQLAASGDWLQNTFQNEKIGFQNPPNATFSINNDNCQLYSNVMTNNIFKAVDKPKEGWFNLVTPPLSREQGIGSISQDVSLNSSNNSEIMRGPTLKMSDSSRNLGYMNILGGNYYGTEKTKENVLKNVRFGLHLSSSMKHQSTSQLRRWSEAAAHEMNDRQDESGNIRRWSVPWDGGQPPVSENYNYWNESKKNLSDIGWSDEQDPLDMAIYLLSCKPQMQGLSSDKTGTVQESIPESSASNNVKQEYSIWSGSDPIPFLKQPDSQGKSNE